MKRGAWFVLILALLCLCAGCEEKRQETVFAMNTVMDLQVWGKDAQEGITQVGKLLGQLDSRWSATEGSSLLGQLNRGEDVRLSEEERDILSRAEAMSARTGGAFDPKMRSVSLAWGFYNEAWHIPTEGELAQAMAQKQWDLGAVMKGYAGQKAAELLESLDVRCALLNLGGNIQTYGEKPDGTPWTVGIQNPNGGDYVGTVSVTGTAAVVTSGDYQRYFEQDGIRYHHILDPKTGAPARSELCSVTVICRDGMTADGLSTALFVMGLEQAAQHWRQSTDFEAVFLTRDGRIFATPGANLSGCEYEVISREN